LDSDDLLAPDALCRVHDSALQECPAIVISKLTFRASNGSTSFANWPYGPRYKSALLRRNPGGGLSTQISLSAKTGSSPCAWLLDTRSGFPRCSTASFPCTATIRWELFRLNVFALQANYR
jgi:hypothetical protein